MELQKLAEKIFAECEKDNEPITMEEALEMARMEIGARGMSRGATTVHAQPTEKKVKTTKVSDQKKALFQTILQNLQENYENVEISIENKLIFVKIDEKKFKIDLIETRK